MNTTPVMRALASETRLVQRLVARDELALRLLYEQYADNLRTVIWWVARNEALAQDCKLPPKVSQSKLEK